MKQTVPLILAIITILIVCYSSFHFGLQRGRGEIKAIAFEESKKNWYVNQMMLPIWEDICSRGNERCVPSRVFVKLLEGNK